jgi:glycine/D-amino acid oxidase-like deaminating enzyme
MRVAVLGAGLQGVAVALELARRGVDVDLFDQDEVPINRASLRNEGKVHLGLVYANDPSGATARSMLDGALSFGRLLERWTNGESAGVALSQPFRYLVARDSLLGADDLACHYAAVESDYLDRLRDDPSLQYLGTRPERLAAPLAGADLARVVSDVVAGGFVTAELAIDLPEFAACLRGAVTAAATATFHGGHRVRRVERTGTGFVVEGTGPAGTWSRRCDQVVNALWDGRLAVDATVGLTTGRRWVNRLKYRILVDLPPALWDGPSVTFVLGAYGDVVIYPGGVGYLSWYPVCMRGWSEELATPQHWDDACRGATPVEEAEVIAREALAEADAWYPGLADARPFAVDAGVIFAWGDTDISDRDSELHRRDDTGVLSVDGYHTVNTGKLTTAPVYAMDTAAAVLDEGAR